jgi:hypothetical protein
VFSSPFIVYVLGVPIYRFGIFTHGHAMPLMPSVGCPLSTWSLSRRVLPGKSARVGAVLTFSIVYASSCVQHVAPFFHPNRCYPGPWFEQNAARIGWDFPMAHMRTTEHVAGKVGWFGWSAASELDMRKFPK